MRSTLLVDGHNLLHRILHVPVFVEMRTESGKGFGGVFGVVKALQKTLSDGVFTRCMVVWDGGRSARRLAIFPAYKAHRSNPTTDEEAKLYFDNFSLQRRYLSMVFKKLGITEITLSGREADDVIWLVRNMYTEEVLILSEDKDFLQMVDETTDLYRPVADRYVVVGNFAAQTGVKYGSYLLYKSIFGDPSDGISGINGIGKVTAQKIANDVELTEEWPMSPAPNKDQVLEFCENHKSKRVRDVASNFDIVLRNLSLVRLGDEEFTTVEMLQVRSAMLQPVNKDFDGVYEMFHMMEFKSIESDYQRWLIPFRRLRGGDGLV